MRLKAMRGGKGTVRGRSNDTSASANAPASSHNNPPQHMRNRGGMTLAMSGGDEYPSLPPPSSSSYAYAYQDQGTNTIPQQEMKVKRTGDSRSQEEEEKDPVSSSASVEPVLMHRSSRSDSLHRWTAIS